MVVKTFMLWAVVSLVVASCFLATSTPPRTGHPELRASGEDPRGKFAEYRLGDTAIRFYEEVFPEERKRWAWEGYGVDGGCPQTVLSAVEITAVSGNYALPEKLVTDLGNPSIEHARVRQNGTLLELAMSNSDGAGGHHVLYQIDLARSKARRFVRMVIEDEPRETHGWTAIDKGTKKRGWGSSPPR